MIDNIKFKFGNTVGQQELEIEVTPITVFVGPNNSGKSRVLIEIERYCRRISGQSNDLIIDKIIFTPYTEDEIKKEIAEIEQIPFIDERVGEGQVIIGKVGAQSNQAQRVQVFRTGLIDEAQYPVRSSGYYATFLDIYTLRLDGTNRLNLLHPQSAGDLQKTPSNHLAHLFINNDLREEVRRIVFEAFGKYYVIDPTNIGQLRVRLSDREPTSEREEKGWETDSVKFHGAALEIANASDGVRAFSGIITTLLAGDPKITLIDEPEAFLHPALSNKLGKEIGKSLRGSKKRLFVSTHSSNFLMGCIQSGAPLNIVRLTYKNGVATARVLSKERILHLMRHPLLRSTGILSGLFFEAVIVCEADSDRAFYQEINERLLSDSDPRGINNCLFLNAQNKQTVWEIVKPLRELGIPTVGIIDIDVLKEGGQVFTKLLEGAFFPSLSHQSYQNQRNLLWTAFKNTGKDMKREGGIDLLIGGDKETCENFFDSLKDYGVFAVRKGELESWLKDLNAVGHGSNWLIDIFSKMGENPDETGYVKPDEGDVWNFIGAIKSWVENPNAKGVPS
jgi:ABC-type cobalamin/Fe3+-siderophores transport system ATPase subunit